MMSRQRLTAIVAALALVLAAGVAITELSGQGSGSPGGTAQAQEIGEDRGVAVDGQGQISVEPDTARIMLGFEDEGQNIDELREESNSRMNAVIDALQEAGIEEDDIRTVAYDITVPSDRKPPVPVPEEPEADIDSQEDSATEAEEEPADGTIYRLVQLLQVTVRDIGQTGDVIDIALDAGANRVGGVQFDVEDRAAAVDQAREQAVEDARSKAEHLAELTGVTLGAPLAIQDRSPSIPAYGADMAFAERAMADADVAAPIEPGESVVTVNVHIVYAIE